MSAERNRRSFVQVFGALRRCENDEALLEAVVDHEACDLPSIISRCSAIVAYLDRRGQAVAARYVEAVLFRLQALECGA